jgi:hypothetical protein
MTERQQICLAIRSDHSHIVLVMFRYVSFALLHGRSSFRPRRGFAVSPTGCGPNTRLAETAQTAQTSKTSMKWASERCREIPRLPAQTAETLRRPDATPACGQPINMWRTTAGLLERAKTGITEKRLESAGCHKALRNGPSSHARRFARTDINSNPWWIDPRSNTNEPRNLGGKAGNAETPADTIACVVRPSQEAAQLGKVSGNCENGANLKNLDKIGIGPVPCSPAQICGNPAQIPSRQVVRATAPRAAGTSGSPRHCRRSSGRTWCRGRAAG